MVAREGIRRIVRLISILAWMCLVGGVAAAISFLFDPYPSQAVLPFFIGIVLFALLQGLAWVIAGFSGNPKESDGLIRLPALRKWKPESRSTSPSINSGPVGIGGWLYLLVIGLLVLGPLQGVGGTIRNIDETEKAYPKLLELAFWHDYKIVIWTLVLGGSALSIFTGYKLLKHHDPSSVKLAIGMLWIRALLVPLGDSIASDAYLNYPIIRYFSDAKTLGNLIGSALMAGIWTLYLNNSRRVRNTYYHRLLPGSSPPLQRIPDKQEPTL